VGIGSDDSNGLTPIDPDESEGLIPSIAVQSELNAFEAQGILSATLWASGNKRFLRTLLTDSGLRELHRRMFRSVWKWAGTYRKTQKSIGVESYRISTEVRNLVSDTQTWIDHRSYEPPEIAARFHHRLVEIHPFPNGNGRHARLATDLLCEREGWPLSLWGASDLVQPSEVRRAYIEALRAADRRDYGPLIDFMNVHIGQANEPPSPR